MSHMEKTVQACTEFKENPLVKVIASLLLIFGFCMQTMASDVSPYSAASQTSVIAVTNAASTAIQITPNNPSFNGCLQYEVQNAGSTDAWVTFGTNNATTVVIPLGGSPTGAELIKAQTKQSLTEFSNAWISAITASGTTTLYVSCGTGAVYGLTTVAGSSAAPLTVTQGPQGAQNSPWWVRPTDGTNNMPMGDAAARAILFRLTDGTTLFSFGQQANASSISVVPTSGGFAVTQSGTWTVQPGNTANTTPWLTTINQGGFSVVVTPANALKVDGSAVTQPENLTQVNTVTVPTGQGASSTGTQRITAASDGIAPVVAGSAASSAVLKASAGNMLNIYVTPATDGWLQVFNATSLPANGATTAGVASGNLQDCIKAPANVTSSISYSPAQVESFSVGITAAFSSTNCATLTASANAFIHGTAQ